MSLLWCCPATNYCNFKLCRPNTGKRGSHLRHREYICSSHFGHKSHIARHVTLPRCSFALHLSKPFAPTRDWIHREHIVPPPRSIPAVPLPCRAGRPALRAARAGGLLGADACTAFRGIRGVDILPIPPGVALPSPPASGQQCPGGSCCCRRDRPGVPFSIRSVCRFPSDL